MPEKVVFSQRAFLSLVCEVAEHLNTETGGLFLGYRFEDYWYIIETVDPGPKAILMPAYFEYEKPYVEHLLNKQARLYEPSPSVLGLWHRHPGSFDRFSNTDDQTNFEFTQQCGPCIISALVNIDPIFRLTVYQADKSLRYQTVKFEVEDDDHCDGLKDYKDIIRSMNAGDGKERNIEDNSGGERILQILSESIISADEQDITPIDDLHLLEVGKWLDEFLKIAEDDIEFLGAYGINVSLSLGTEYRLTADFRGPSSEDVRISIGFEHDQEEISLIMGNRRMQYIPGALKRMASKVANLTLGEE